MIADEMPGPGQQETGVPQPVESATMPDVKAAMKGVISRLADRNTSEFGGELCGVLEINGSKAIAFPDWLEDQGQTNDPFRFLIIADDGYKAIEMDREFGNSEDSSGLSYKDFVSHILSQGESWGVSMNDNAIVFGGGGQPALYVEKEGAEGKTSINTGKGDAIKTDKVRWIPDLPAEDALDIAKARIEDAKKRQGEKRARIEEEARKANAKINAATEISNLLD